MCAQLEAEQNFICFLVLECSSPVLPLILRVAELTVAATALGCLLTQRGASECKWPEQDIIML